MLNDIFNKTAQAGEDVYYGLMLESMSAGRKLRMNLWGGMGAALGVVGLTTGDVSAVFLSAASLASTAFCLGEAGARIRKGATSPAPEL